MKLFFTLVYIRIISLRWKFDDHPLVEYPLLIRLGYIYEKFVIFGAHPTFWLNSISFWYGCLE